MAHPEKNKEDIRTSNPVVVVYEDAGCQETCVTFCDHLVRRFWPTHGIDIRWCSFSYLQDPANAAASAQDAAGSPLILFAVRPDGELPIDVALWIQKWLSKRAEREGVLVGLLDPGTGTTNDKYVYLRNVAHRAGMDYLTTMPKTLSVGIPDSLDSYSQRADRVTGVLAEILKNQPVRSEDLSLTKS
jgi:hypothetical protein